MHLLVEEEPPPAESTEKTNIIGVQIHWTATQCDIDIEARTHLQDYDPRSTHISQFRGAFKETDRPRFNQKCLSFERLLARPDFNTWIQSGDDRGPLIIAGQTITFPCLAPLEQAYRVLHSTSTPRDKRCKQLAHKRTSIFLACKILMDEASSNRSLADFQFSKDAMDMLILALQTPSLVSDSSSFTFQTQLLDRLAWLLYRSTNKLETLQKFNNLLETLYQLKGIKLDSKQFKFVNGHQLSSDLYCFKQRHGPDGWTSCFQFLCQSCFNSVSVPELMLSPTNLRYLDEIISQMRKSPDYRNWFCLLTFKYSGQRSFTEIALTLRRFFDLLKKHTLQPPPVSNFPEFMGKMDHMKAILNLMDESSDTMAQLQLLKSLPTTLVEGLRALRAGFRVVDNLQQLTSPFLAVRKDNSSLEYDREPTHGEKPRDLSDLFPGLFTSGRYLVNYEAFLALKYQRTHQRTDYLALALRLAAVNANSYLATRGQMKKLLGDSATDQDFFTDIKALVANNCASDALAAERQPALPRHMAHSKHCAPQNTNYLPTQIQRVLGTLSLSSAEHKQICDALQTLNTMRTTCRTMDAPTLRAAASNLNEQPDFAHKLAVLREVVYRLSGEKKWLRLEQALAVLLMDKHENTFCNIDTGEGKTLVIQLYALIQAKSGQSVTVFTHSVPLAQEACDQAEQLASILGVKVSDQSQGPRPDEHQLFFTSTDRAILDYLSQIVSGKPYAPSTVAILDEADEQAFNAEGRTTMRLTQKQTEANTDFRDFLNALNTAVKHLAKDSRLMNPYEQNEFVMDILKDQLTANTIHQAIESETNFINFWVNAAIAAMALTDKVDYVVLPSENNTAFSHQLLIVNKDTNGRLNHPDSKWHNGIYQCLVARIMAANAELSFSLPFPAKVLAESDYINFLKLHKYLHGLSGTLDSGPAHDWLHSQFDAQSYTLPRSQLISTELVRARTDYSTDDQYALSESSLETYHQPCWQEIGDTRFASQTLFLRRYEFPTQIFQDRRAHLTALLHLIERCSQRGFSALIFFNTIAQCHAIRDLLLSEKSAPLQRLRVIDDLPTGPGDVPETTLISEGGGQGCIMLATQAAGRGIDFSDIDQIVHAMPAGQRATRQRTGRGGRKGTLSMVHHLYCALDFPTIRDDQTHNQTVISFQTDMEKEAHRRASLRHIDSSRFLAQAGFFATRPSPADVEEWARAQKQTLSETKQRPCAFV